jgi:hypothetical protein
LRALAVKAASNVAIEAEDAISGWIASPAKLVVHPDCPFGGDGPGHHC